MKKTLARILFLAVTTAPSLFALDLTPHEAVVGNAGPASKRYFFQDEGKRFSFHMDGQMSVSGSSESALFLFSDMKQAAVKISKSQLTPATPFDKKNMESYRIAAHSLLPPDAVNVQMEEKANPITINGWTSQQFIFQYNLSGFPFSRSVTFLNFNDREQIVFDVSADAKGYQKSYTRGYRVLNTLTDAPVKADGPT